MCGLVLMNSPGRPLGPTDFMTSWPSFQSLTTMTAVFKKTRHILSFKFQKKKCAQTLKYVCVLMFNCGYSLFIWQGAQVEGCFKADPTSPRICFMFMVGVFRIKYKCV